MRAAKPAVAEFRWAFVAAGFASLLASAHYDIIRSPLLPKVLRELHLEFGDAGWYLAASSRVATVTAGLLGTGGAALAVVTAMRETRRPSIFLGVLTLAAAFGSLGIYMVELGFGGPPRLAVPVLEHVAALCLLAWMLAFEVEKRV